MTDLRELIEVARGNGVHWTLEAPGELNVNLVHLDAGHGIGEHVNDAVDVVIVVLAGEGQLTIDGRGSALAPHVVAHVPRGSRRRLRATGDRGVDYLSIHRRRGPLDVGPSRSPARTGAGAPATGAPADGAPADEGGDPACWAHLFEGPDAGAEPR